MLSFWRKTRNRSVCLEWQKKLEIKIDNQIHRLKCAISSETTNKNEKFRVFFDWIHFEKFVKKNSVHYPWIRLGAFDLCSFWHSQSSYLVICWAMPMSKVTKTPMAATNAMSTQRSRKTLNIITIALKILKVLFFLDNIFILVIFSTLK